MGNTKSKSASLKEVVYITIRNNEKSNVNDLPSKMSEYKVSEKKFGGVLTPKTEN
jgi:hypothetical protein